MKNGANITVDAMNEKIFVSKSFYKRASVYGTDEYKALHNALVDNPRFSIEFKESEKKTYGKLTIKRMKDYIETQPNMEENLKEIERVMIIAKAKGAMYPLTKKWFLAKFPEYKENEVKISAAESKEDESSNDNIIEAINNTAA